MTKQFKNEILETIKYYEKNQNTQHIANFIKFVLELKYDDNCTGENDDGQTQKNRILLLLKNKHAVFYNEHSTLIFIMDTYLGGDDDLANCEEWRYFFIESGYELEMYDHEKETDDGTEGLICIDLGDFLKKPLTKK